MSDTSVIGRSAATGYLDEAAIEDVVERGVRALDLAGKRVLVLVPDSTRTFPMPMLFRLLAKHMAATPALDFLIALGTHAPMPEDAILKMFGLSRAEKDARYGRIRILNHAWDDPGALVDLGTIPAGEIAALSGGRLRQDVVVRLNRLVMEYDALLVCGPVFPHEVVGFSGGNKYFFPGIAGPDIINFTHWLSALITSYEIIGTKDTVIRGLIDRAASMIPRPRLGLLSVVTHDGVAGIFAGTTEAAFSAAADVSAERHVIWCDRPWRQVLSVLPEMYDEMWVGAKGMYKLEPAMADGGEVIIYGPHVKEWSRVHGAAIRRIGYHTRDYFVANWDRYKHESWGVLAHSTHLRGNGTYENGVERARIRVTLATGIPEAECRAMNLGYRDPATVDPRDFAGREAEGVLLVPRAGEYLYRLKSQRR